jgi:anti-sigma B factor antagonist
MTSSLAENALADGRRVITASGELDRIELPHLKSAIQNAFSQGVVQLVLDLAEVSYLDSSVLAALIAESIDADRRGDLVVIVTGTTGIMRSLELKGLTQVMHIAESVDAAIASLPPLP